MFEAKIVKDSINDSGNRLTTYVLTYPRFIHSELMTHRAFSKSSASSRAIPVSKMIEQVKTDPATPLYFGLNGKGMSDHGVLPEAEQAVCLKAWKQAALEAADHSTTLAALNVHKQHSNRLLEPFMWMKTVLTATEFDNFYSLRLHPKAQPEFQHIAYLMAVSNLASTPVHVPHGGWHLPFVNDIEIACLGSDSLKVATARAARISYYVTEPKDHSQEIALHDQLLEDRHWAPFEHVAHAGTERSGNLLGWTQYRKLVEPAPVKPDLQQLVKDYEERNPHL